VRGGQTYFMQNKTKRIKEIACPSIVKLIFTFHPWLWLNVLRES
jgi:hypothetical protein